MWISKECQKWYTSQKCNRMWPSKNTLFRYCNFSISIIMKNLCPRYWLFFLEHVYMRPEKNSNQFEISLQGNISLWCKVISLLAFTWVQEKWNSFWCKFHFSQVKVTLIEVKFQTAMGFPYKQQIPAVN